MSLSRRDIAEFIGTFWLVFAGCGSAVLAAGFPSLGIGFAGVALAFGLTLLTMAYAIGRISGSISIPRSALDCGPAGVSQAARLRRMWLRREVSGLSRR
jgi:aquaporin Z